MNIVYFETSAADYFLNHISGIQALATREFQVSMKRNWTISTITLWELMQIKDYEHYDQYLYNASILFNNRLLKSPSEIVLDYIIGKKFINVYSRSYIANKWEKACSDKSYSFIIKDDGFTKITNDLRSISKSLPSILFSIECKDNSIWSDIIGNICNELYSHFFKDDKDEIVVWLRKISMLICFLLICMNKDMGNDYVLLYWGKMRINDPLDHLQYLFQKKSDIFQTGPLWLISNVILIQLLNKNIGSRGAIHDGLHAVYLPYVNWFFTKDRHLVKIRDESKEDVRNDLYYKIHHLDEMEITSRNWTIKKPFFTIRKSK